MDILTKNEINRQVILIAENNTIPVGTEGKIIGINQNGKVAELELAGNVRICCFVDKLELVDLVETIGPKPAIKTPKPNITPDDERHMRAERLMYTAIDFPAIIKEKEMLESSIVRMQKKIVETQEQLKQLDNLPKLAAKRANRLARMKLSDAAVIAEIASIDELKSFVKKD